MDKIWNISEINAAVRSILETSLESFWLQGEIGTLNIHSSGHVYMTLKDQKSQLRGVFFGGAAQARAMPLQVGSQIEAFGHLTVYEVRGEYQFSIRMVRPRGVGELQRLFEELKNKLQAEGLFEQDRKKPIPKLPGRIGVITSPDGAALRDFLNVIERRFPDINIRVYPAPVQGDGAEYVLARGIEYFNSIGGADVIVLTRGGGSMEDLQPFNTEVLARAIAASTIPVISAVGHEIDFSICDFVADLRVPTPSAAAELAVGQRAELTDSINNLKRRFSSSVKLRMEQSRSRLQGSLGSYIFRDPLRLLERPKQRIDDYLRDATGAVEDILSDKRLELQKLHTSLAQLRPENALRQNRIMIDNLLRRLCTSGERNLEQRVSAVKSFESRLRALDPDAVIRRGYSVLHDASGKKVIASVKDVKSGDAVKARVADGEINLTAN